MASLKLESFDELKLHCPLAEPGLVRRRVDNISSVRGTEGVRHAHVVVVGDRDLGAQIAGLSRRKPHLGFGVSTINFKFTLRPSGSGVGARYVVLVKFLLFKAGLNLYACR